VPLLVAVETLPCVFSFALVLVFVTPDGAFSITSAIRCLVAEFATFSASALILLAGELSCSFILTFKSSAPEGTN